ncbi:MAG: PHP domain-containing protein, partial [Lachnospiraceae bacterium]|nr:PHP domain-containing protein [Lachnospiraceae bacterium]
MKLYEVFDSVNPPQELRRVFDETEVLKLSASRQSGGVTVHIESERLLEYRTVRHLEKVLNDQFFRGMDKNAVVAEHYKLSAQYTPASIWEHYNESVREELGAESRLNAGFLNRAEISVNGTEMHIKSEDTFINKHIGEEVKSCIEELFLSRFEVPLRVINEFYEVAKEEPETGDAPVRPAYEFYSRDKLRSMGVMPAKEEEEEYDGEGANGAEEATNGQNGTTEGVGNGANGGSGQTSGTGDGQSGTNGKAAASAGQSGQEKASGADKAAKAGSEKKTDDKNGKADFKKFERNGNYTPKKKIPEDPDIFYGKPFDGELSPISDVDDGFGDYVIRGKIIKFEERELRNEKLLFMFQITDFTNSIGAKIFVRKEEADELRGKLKPGKFVLMKGQVMFDTYEKEVSVGVIYGMKNIKDFTKKRMDTAERKRIELLAHTKMSDMDAVVDPSVLVKTAFEWGMPGVAITDHGVVQAFP